MSAVASYQLYLEGLEWVGGLYGVLQLVYHCLARCMGSNSQRELTCAGTRQSIPTRLHTPKLKLPGMYMTLHSDSWLTSTVGRVILSPSRSQERCGAHRHQNETDTHPQSLDSESTTRGVRSLHLRVPCTCANCVAAGGFAVQNVPRPIQSGRV